MKAINIFLVLCCLLLQNCNNENRFNITVEKQGSYSLYSTDENHPYGLVLNTTLIFENLSNHEIVLPRKDYNNFYIIFRKDTFAIVPNNNNVEFIIKPNDKKSLDYNIVLYYKFNKDSINSEISSCPVKQYGDSAIILKSLNYEIYDPTPFQCGLCNSDGMKMW